MNEERQQSGTLAGKFLDRRSSHPLAEARLSVVGHDGRATFGKTNAAGEFSLKLPEGVYDLAISARGYLSMLIRGLGVLSGHRVEIVRALVPGEAGSEPPADVTTAIAGYVTDRLGSALQHVAVELRSDAHKQHARTERNGAYVFHSVPLGDYDIFFRAGDRALEKVPVAIPSTKTLTRIDKRLDQA